MLELNHLRIIDALDRQGTLTRAAQALHLTQSALSHQIRQLESRSGAQVWRREGRRLVFTATGRELLRTARRVLPLVEDAEHALRLDAEGMRGMVRIGVECYPCYEWLTGTISRLLEQMPDVEMDIVSGLRFSGIEALLTQQIDLLITPDPYAHRALHYEPLFDYELVLLVAASHRLADRGHVQAEDLGGETLLTFPVDTDRLDIYTQFLWPAGVRPRRHKRIESVDIMVQMAVHGRGLCVLPRWLAERNAGESSARLLSLGDSSIHKTLHAAMRADDAGLAYMRRIVELGREQPPVLD
ncbi:LysR family transcriptional regulator [uncultured Abyssibacter sp.]|uniref:LysR family transcriptional regulator n=1 Tax=uncultured Abyssibacter sp. TaxID=2320202 RepID=UPI0032B29594